MLIALALILVGGLFLFRNTGILPSPAWELVWPIVLIVFGVALFLGRRADGRHAEPLEFGCCGDCRCSDEKQQ